MLIDYKLTQTGIILRVKLRNSSVTTGAGLTGLTNASTGLTIAAMADVEAATTAYTQAGGTIDSIAALGTYAAPTATHCRFKEVDSTNHKGIYEIQLENSRSAVANAKYLQVSISGVTNLAECDVVIPLRGVDLFNAGTAGAVPRISDLSTNFAQAKYPKGVTLYQQFPMTLASNGQPATGKTVTVQCSIDGAAYANCTGGTPAAQATEVGNGDYGIQLSIADRTGNRIMYRATATGCNPTAFLIDSDG